MDYANVVGGSPTQDDYRELFTTPLDSIAFAKALSATAKSIPESRGPHQAWQGIFKSGLLYFSNAIGYRDHEFEDENAMDYKGSVPEEDITQQTGIASQLPADDGEDITLQGEDHLEEEKEATGDSDDDHDLGGETSEKSAKVVLGASEKDILGASEKDIIGASGLSISLELDTKERESNSGSADANGLNHNTVSTGSTKGKSSLSVDMQISEKNLRNEEVSRISEILRIWFAELWAASEEYNKDMVGLIFGLPGTSSGLTEKHLYELLVRIKWFIGSSLEDEYSSSLKELILLLHEILHALFRGATLERDNQAANHFLIVKSLLFTFYKADLSQTLDLLLTATNGKVELNEEKQNKRRKENGETNGTDGSVKKEPRSSELRLSYGTLMHIYVIFDSLANSPLHMLLVDKVSLSLDITTLDEVSANVYSNLLIDKDFDDKEVVSVFEDRVIPLLSAMFNYHYGLFPDVLSANLSHTSFFSWITGHTFSPDLYVGIDTIRTVTNFPEDSKNIHDPFLYQVQQYEIQGRLASSPEKDTEAALRSPTFLALSLKLRQLVKNPSFTRYLTKFDEEKEIPLLDIWLSVSSYVHHYQFKSLFNQYGARISLLTLLKLTSTKSPTVKLLRDYKINENKWKLCHQRPPVIPISDGDGMKSALLYIVDVVQITLRFNLTKKLDMDNCKLALTVLYQILLEGAESPFDDLQSYKWLDLYKTLVHFVKFLDKNCNEEDVKYVIEEVFCIFDLILSPAYDHIIERSSDFWLLGSHVARSVNFDLFYEILQHYDYLHALFDKYIIRKGNFARVESSFQSLGEKFDMTSHRELDLSEVTAKLNELSLLSDDEVTPTLLQLSKFNYAETFKYLDKYHDYIDFEKQVEILDIFNLLYDNKWVQKK